MYSAAALLLLAGSAVAEPRNFTTIQPTGTFNPIAATAVQTEYPKDHHIVRGRYGDFMWHIILDNADYDDAANNEDLQYLHEHYGILLTNYYAVESNSQANYIAMLGGDTFGLNEERFVSLPSNVSSVVESLESGRVLWAQYAEDQPFTAYDGWEYPAEDPVYSRAKNPFVAFDSIMESPKRYFNLRSLSRLQHDLEDHRFPQWVFIRPNLEHDGTNSDLATAAKWVRDFLTPFLDNKSTNHRHLYHVTFARTSSNTGDNHVYSLLLGDVKGQGTTDDNYYDHYSIAASAQANYDLPSMGRFDCSANVFDIVNSKCHIADMSHPDVNGTENYNQGPFSGYFSDDHTDLPVPNLNCDRRNGLIHRVGKIWKKASYSYDDWVHQY